MSREIDGLRPGGRVAGRVAIPGSKSIAQRWLVAAGLAGGTTRLAGLPDGADVTAAIAALDTAGADVLHVAPHAVSITGRPPGPHRGLGADAASDYEVAVGESGTGARLVTAALALCAFAGRPVTVRASGTLLRRRSPALFRALRAVGVGVESLGIEDGWPARLVPSGPPSELELVEPGSSQELSALLIALAAYPSESLLSVVGDVPSRPYVGLTVDTIERFGGHVGAIADLGDAEVWRVRGPLVPPPGPLTVEPDASAAAVALAAGCLSGGAVEVPGLTLGSGQGDVRIVEHLAAFGCDAGATTAGLRASGAPSRGATVDLDDSPDLAPVLAAVAAGAALECGARSELTGLGTLPGKESSRIEVLATGLAAIGLDVRATGSSLSIGPSSARAVRVGEVVLDPSGDHRMAFAFALLGLVHDGVRVRDPGCVAKSWPTFWSDLERAGARRIE